MESRSKPLPHHFTGWYQSYKQKTQEVIEWLLLNAGSCDSSAISAATPRKSNGSRKTLKVKTRALIDLAETVKSKKTLVPAVILKDLEQVVQYRREFASWYELKGSGTRPRAILDISSSLVLCEKVHQLLAYSEAPAPARVGLKNGKGAASSSTVDAALLDKTVRNLFAQLKVDEPSASPLGQVPE